MIKQKFFLQCVLSGVKAFLQPDGAAEHSPEGDVLAEDAGGRVALEGDVHGVRDRLQHRHLLRRT